MQDQEQARRHISQRGEQSYRDTRVDPRISWEGIVYDAEMPIEQVIRDGGCMTIPERNMRALANEHEGNQLCELLVSIHVPQETATDPCSYGENFSEGHLAVNPGENGLVVNPASAEPPPPSPPAPLAGRSATPFPLPGLLPPTPPPDPLMSQMAMIHDEISEGGEISGPPVASASIPIPIGSEALQRAPTESAPEGERSSSPSLLNFIDPSPPPSSQSETRSWFSATSPDLMSTSELSAFLDWNDEQVASGIDSRMFVEL